MRTAVDRSLLLAAALSGAIALTVAFSGSALLGWVAGVVALAVLLVVVAWRACLERPADPGRRRFLALTGLAGVAAVGGGGFAGRLLKQVTRPDPRPIQEHMAADLGAEYLELVRRAYHPGRSGDLQLLLAPFNSSNYSNESTSLVPLDPRTSHASVWMYLERVPLVIHAPGRVRPSDHTERVTLADLAPTTAAFMGFDGWPPTRAGRVLPGQPPEVPGEGVAAPKVVVTFVIDGGGWNVLHQWPDRWPNLKRLMRSGATYRNAITGSFPAVTACAHATIGTGTFPGEHGVTGHNIRDGRKVRKAYGEPGRADPGDILVPTLADLWSDATENAAWIGEIGYQIWHVGMIGHGGTSRGADDRPVAVYWDEGYDANGAIGGWAPQNPDLFRMPAGAPGLDAYAAHAADFVAPDWDVQFTPGGRQSPCCSPPVVRYQGDLIDATLRNEPVGRTNTTDLLYINFKSPDYTGHIYNMLSNWEGLILQEVDAQLGRLVATLDELYPEDYVLIVTADHGQCPLPDRVDGVRLDPIQLGRDIDREFSQGLFTVVQSVVPSEVYLHTDVLWDGGATAEDVASFLRGYRYRQNIGPYVPRGAIEQGLLDRPEFAAVFATSYIADLADRDLKTFGEGRFADADPGIPEIA
jgi:hypothetical protein